jgi:hypothetical protein
MMTSANDFTRLVPGFDFLQGLMKSGGAAMPGIGQWIAPTLDPEELQLRIDELRTVQFWLEQNAKLLGTTIQALEVQRMTLATLEGMNVPMVDLTRSLVAVPPGARSGRLAGSAGATGASASPAAGKTAPAKAPAPSVDPLQWWSALTQQFTELATKALKDGSAEMARSLTGAAVKQGLETASSSIERAMKMSGHAVGGAAPAAGAAQPPQTAKAAKVTKSAKAAKAPMPTAPAEPGAAPAQARRRMAR